MIRTCSMSLVAAWASIALALISSFSSCRSDGADSKDRRPTARGPNMELRPVLNTESSTAHAGSESSPYREDRLVLGEPYPVRVATARAMSDELGFPAVECVVRSEDTSMFDRWIGEHLRQRIAVVIDGKVQSLFRPITPFAGTSWSGKVMITNEDHTWSEQDAVMLANRLQARSPDKGRVLWDGVLEE